MESDLRNSGEAKGNRALGYVSCDSSSKAHRRVSKVCGPSEKPKCTNPAAGPP